jgi:hypothetical protein
MSLTRQSPELLKFDDRQHVTGLLATATSDDLTADDLTPRAQSISGIQNTQIIVGLTLLATSQAARGVNG